MAAQSQCLSTLPTSIHRRMALAFGLVVGLCAMSARAQEVVTDAPVAQPGGTANIGFYSADGSVTGGPAFHFTQDVVLQNVAFDPGPGGAQELRVVTMNGCALGQPIPGEQMCGVGTEIVSRYPGLRSGTLRVVTTAKSFAIPVSFVSYGSQVAVAPGAVVSPVAGQTVTATGNAMALDAVGNIYLSDPAASVLRKVDAIFGTVSIVAGTLNNHDQSGDGGLATAAAIGAPSDMTISAAGDLYIVSSVGATTAVRKVSANTGIISTVASLKADARVVADAIGNVFIAVPTMHQLLALTPAQEQKALIGESCNASTPYEPSTMALHNGHLYFASGSQVFKISADVSACQPVVLVAGTGAPGNSGDGGLATSAALGTSLSLALDAAGDLYIADATNNVVRMVGASSGTITTIAGAGATLSGISVGKLALDVRGHLLLLGASGTVQKIDVTSSSVNFGETVIGDGSSNTRSVLFTNTGNTAMAVGTPILTGGFVLDASSTCGQGNASATLAPGASCTAVVSFQPVVAGSVTGSLRMMGVMVALSGTATGSSTTPIAKLSTATIDFDSVPQGSSTSSSVTLSNTSGAPLAISSLTLADTKNFAMSGNCGSTVAAHSTCTMTVTFKPQTMGSFQTTLTLTTNSSNAVQTVALAGKSSGYTFTMDSPELTLRPGQSGMASFTLNPSGGYAGTVAFSCVGLPANVTCNFAPATLTADGSDRAQATKLTVTMLTASASARTGGNVAMAAVFGFGSLSLLWFKRRNGASLKVLAVLVIACTASLGMIGCGGVGSVPASATITANSVQVMAVGTAVNAAVTSTQTASFTLNIMQ